MGDMEQGTQEEKTANPMPFEEEGQDKTSANAALDDITPLVGAQPLSWYQCVICLASSATT